MPAQTRPAETTHLFLLEELEDVSRTSELPQGDLEALRTVADWTKSFIVEASRGSRPRRARTVPSCLCPWQAKTLWLAPEHVDDRSAADVAGLVSGYQRLFLGARPADGDDAIYKAIVVVFTDLPPDQAGGLFDDVLKDLAVPSYVEDGFVMGGSYAGNEAGAIYNASFRPFTSPVPFLLIRQAVDQRLEVLPGRRRVARDAGGSATEASGAEALGRELRRLPWRAQRGSRPRPPPRPTAALPAVRQGDRIAERALDIDFRAPGVEAYVFTFG